MVDARLAVAVVTALIGVGCAAPGDRSDAEGRSSAVAVVADVELSSADVDRAVSASAADRAVPQPAPSSSARRPVGSRTDAASLAPLAAVRASVAPDCRCEVWLADVLVEDVRAEDRGVPIGPVVAVFGDSITNGFGLLDRSWVDRLRDRRPDLEVRQQAVVGMSIVRAPANNMVDHISVGGAGRAHLVGVDTVIYMAGLNDLNSPEADVDAAVAGLAQVRALLESAPIDHFILLPMLPVGEAWATRTDGIGPGPRVIDWLDEFNRRVVAEGIATPFDPGFDADGDGFGDEEIYAGFVNLEPDFAATGGVDAVHPGPLGHERLAERVDELLRRAETVGIANVGVGAGSSSTE